MSILLANKLVLIVLGSLVLLAMLLIFIVTSSNQPCLEGGIMGSKCNCLGYKLIISKDSPSNADGLTEYKCVGINL